MGKYKPYLFFGAAVLIALIVTVLIYNYLQEKGRPTGVAPEEKVSIASAVNNISGGTVLIREMIKQADFLKASLPGGYFSDPSSLVGRVVIFPIGANEPIFESRLAPITVKTGGVAALVTPKKRAVAVKVDRVIGVAGFIHAGNRVDVLVTIEPKGAGQIPQPITKVVLENILVLATGTEIERKGKEEKASPVDVITLEVTPVEAEKLALAATEGKIQLALRNFTDTEDVLTKGMTIPALLASYVSIGPPVTTAKADVRKGVRPRPAAPEKPPMFVVQLIKGSKVSEVKVEGSE